MYFFFKSADELAEAFKTFDKDSNGYINTVDLKILITETLKEEITDQEIDQMIREADSDRCAAYVLNEWDD